MEEVGFIVALEKKGKKAKVSFSRKAACEGCNMCMKHKDDMRVTCIVDNRLNAKIGDEVKVHMGTGYVMLSAFIVYLIPLFLSGLSLLCTMNLAEWIRIVVFSCTLVFAFIIVSILDKVVGKKKGFKPEMVEIIKK